jgi:hypothetical protein
MKALLLASLFFVFSSALLAQEENNVSLTIRFANDTSQFRAGEIIPVELAFRSTVPNQYDFECRNYDRSGRLNMEQFHVTPTGRDPLAQYFSEGGPWMMGGLGGPRELTSDPQTLREDLNEWVALDQPGHYTLSVTSRRVSRRVIGKNEIVEVRSNPLEFDVVASDQAWQHQAFASAVAALRLGSSTRGERDAALRVLRFLDSPESVRELVRLLGTDPQASLSSVLGLAGSRYQSLAIRELEGQMSAPDIALTGSYLSILAKLKFQQENDPFPPYPKDDTDEQRAWMERRRSRDKSFGELQDRIYDKAATLVRIKQGVAKAETVETLLLRSSPSGIPSELPASLSGEEVASAFVNLPPEQQLFLLRTSWNRMQAPEMVASLKSLTQDLQIKNETLRDLAFKRLYELSPKEATPLFLEEIRNPRVTDGIYAVTGATLGMLPNETLPEFDQLLTDRLEKNKSGMPGLDAQLIGRYASKAVFPQVKSIYENHLGRWPCVTEDGFFVYFLRVDPDFGVKTLAQSGGFCLNQAFANVAKMNRWGEVEPRLIGRLNDADLWHARDAAETLAKYGSPKAEEAMWERLRQFHMQWEARGDELSIRPGMKKDANEAVGFQFGLVEALGGAQAWLLTDDQVTELENFTLGGEKENVKHWHWSSPVGITVNCTGPQMIINFTGRYFATDVSSMRNKLAQYPNGTKFMVRFFCSQEEKATVLGAINEIAAEHNFEIAQAEETN